MAPRLTPPPAKNVRRAIGVGNTGERSIVGNQGGQRGGRIVNRDKSEPRNQRRHPKGHATAITRTPVLTALLPTAHCVLDLAGTCVRGCFRPLVLRIWSSSSAASSLWPASSAASRWRAAMLVR